MKFLLMLGLVLLWPVDAQSDLRTEMIECKHGDAVLEGYLAYDASINGERPGVLVVHEW